MSAPYRERGAPPDDGTRLVYDYAKAIRDADKPRVIARGFALAASIPIGCVAVYSLLLQITLVHFLEISGAILGFYGVLIGPFLVIAIKREKEQAAVQGLLDDLDKRDRR